MKTSFYGPVIVACCFFSFGMSTGFTFYNIPFFFDYFAKPVVEGGHGWSIDFITLGMPIAMLFAMWIGPLLIPRLTPRTLILTGSGLTALSFQWFALMDGSSWQYFGAWLLFTGGYVLAGPVPHQIIISNWYDKKRGRAMGITYIGIAIFGWAGTKIAPFLLLNMDYKSALQIMGLLVLLIWPVAIFLIKNSPEEVGQNPDGEDLQKETDNSESINSDQEVKTFKYLGQSTTFWLLLLGSAASIGAIASMNIHLKFILQEQGFTDQEARNAIWSTIQGLILLSSIGGRVIVGWLADIFPKKLVMLSTYALIAISIPLVFLIEPESHVIYIYIFSVAFGFGMGADYMIIPLMAAEVFGLRSLGRVMSVIVPTDTLSLTWAPKGVAMLKTHFSSYDNALWAVFGLAALGAAAISLLPNLGKQKAG